jgi:excisionase family DNA binding protein
MPIRDLAAHTANYVTVAELAEYWAVSRQQIYKRIESGALEAIRLGARLYRIRTRAALEYERRASVAGTSREGALSLPSTAATHWNDRGAMRAGLRRVVRDTESE